MNNRISSALASSAQGKAYYCACRKLVTLEFKGRWFALGPGELPRFRSALIGLIEDPALVRRLVAKARAEAERRGVPSDDLPSLEDLREMLMLVDASALILEAQEIAERA